MKKSITLSQALHGYALYAKVRRLSLNTLNDYNNTFNKFQKFLVKDLPLAEITKYQVQEFLALYEHLSEKTILNYHTGLSALWTWALEEGLVEEQIIRQVEPPTLKMRSLNLLPNKMLSSSSPPVNDLGPTFVAISGKNLVTPPLSSNVTKLLF